MKLHLSIFHKLLLALLAVSLVPLCTMWAMSQSNTSRDLNANIAQYLVSTMDAVAVGVNAWEDTNLRALRQTARLPDVISMKTERQLPVLKAVSASYEWSYLVFTIAPDGTNIGRSDDQAPINYADRSYVKEVVGGKEIGRQVVISKSTKAPALILAVPVRNEDYHVVGVVAMGSNLKDITKTVASARIGATGHALLLDATNKVIANGAAVDAPAALQDFSDYPALKAEGIYESPREFTENGKRMIGFARKLPQGWTLLIVQNYDEAYLPLTRSERDARVLIAIAVALVVGIAYLLGKQLTRPIQNLTRIATQLSEGKLDIDIPDTARTDEIGALAKSIERLGISLQMAMDRLRKKA
jgi:methyl-accepting chemotaxis protein